MLRNSIDNVQMMDAGILRLLVIQQQQYYVQQTWARKILTVAIGLGYRLVLQLEITNFNGPSVHDADSLQNEPLAL